MTTQPLDRSSDPKALPRTPPKSGAPFHVLLKNSANNKKVEAHDKTPSGLDASKKDGYELAAKDAAAPPALADYKAIGPPDEVGPGLIRYETQDGKKVIVSEQDSPELFKQVSQDFKSLSGVVASQNAGYQSLGADGSAPAKLADYKSLGPPDETGPGVIRYETQDGTKVVISQRDNPEAFQKAKEAYESFTGLATSEDAGYKRASDNEVWPPYGGTAVGPVDEVGPGLIRFESNGQKMVVARDDNPKLFDYLAGLHAVYTDPGKKAVVEGELNNGAVLADANTPVPGLNDYKNFSWNNDQKDHILTYELHDGTKVVVSSDVSPELFKRVATANETWAKIHTSEGEGYKLAGPNDFLKNTDITFGSPDELGDGLIRYETSEGKVIVSKELSPQLYDDVAAKWEASSASSVDDTRAKHNLPKADELDVLNMDTGVHADEKDDKSPTLSVSELATTQLIDTYRAGVKDGSIPKDDPRAKLVRALEAQAAYQNGHGITGYEEAKRPFNTTWREFDDKQTELTSADMHDIIDGKAVQKQIGELFNDPTVQADYKSKMDEAINKLPNKDEIKQKLLDLTSNPEYVLYLKDLQSQGKTYEAQKDLSDTLTSLQLFDPEAASKAAQNIQADGLTTDLNAILADPSKISDENKELATKDLFGLLKGVLKGNVLDLPRRTQETLEKFLNEGLQGKEKSAAVTKALEELGDVYKKNGVISETDLKTALSKPYIPVADRGMLGEVFNTLNSKGILGSLGAGVSLFSGIYQLVGKGGKLGETPAQRMTIAKDFLSFAGGSSHFVRLGDKIGESLGKGGLVDFLGLDKTLPEIWGKTGMQEPNFEFRVSELPSEVKSKIATALDAVPDSQYDGISTLFGDGDKAVTEATEGLATHLDDGLAAAGAAKLGASKSAKIAGSVIKVLGPATDIAGGFADIVLGALAIKSGVKDKDPLAQAAGGLQVAGGAFGASAGVLGAAALFGAGTAAALTGPLFLVGVVLAVVGGIIGYFVDHNKKQKATEKENDWYRDLAGDGLLQDNWADKVEYAHYEIHHYGGRDAPTDDSIFRFQQSEWEHFDETPQKGGSSSNRLDGGLHKDYKDPNEKPKNLPSDAPPERPQPHPPGGSGPKIA
ncbi:hypothetical protein CWC48_27125 [Pseudomonas sp. S10E 269]|uniref:hypothetical protein n=1 Tax=unclassified Pseudomonas TaxID=196821 RepID=UPI000C25D52B|nr:MULTISPECIES: hypothetical protein [unclassified Pseudomonas]PJK33152.1 hypothetical protein CWC49_07565 [Pseudomonas sp. S09F 262]PJK42645.1 hypothetical protein CWC48_27125 [Pseudomonas sp. S10E 269]